jgi:hypothetical protein
MKLRSCTRNLCAQVRSCHAYTNHCIEFKFLKGGNIIFSFFGTMGNIMFALSYRKQDLHYFFFTFWDDGVIQCI